MAFRVPCGHDSLAAASALVLRLEAPHIEKDEECIQYSSVLTTYCWVVGLWVILIFVFSVFKFFLQ